MYEMDLPMTKYEMIAYRKPELGLNGGDWEVFFMSNKKQRVKELYVN